MAGEPVRAVDEPCFKRFTIEPIISLCRNSTVELELGAGHETALVRREVNDPIGYVGRFAKASERHLARQFSSTVASSRSPISESRIGS